MHVSAVPSGALRYVVSLAALLACSVILGPASASAAAAKPSAATAPTHSSGARSHRPPRMRPPRARTRRGKHALARASVAGSVSRGVVECSNTPNDPFSRRMQAYGPLVKAANRTSAVDYQHVYWRARAIVPAGLLNASATQPWTDWTWAYAADNAWTGAYYRSSNNQRLTGDGWRWDLPLIGGGGRWVVENEVWFYDRGEWSFWGFVRSAKGLTSGQDASGAGFC